MSLVTTSEAILERDQHYVANALKIRYFPFVAAEGDGPYLIDPEGNRYLDFGAGWALASLGYSNERVRKAVREQLDRTTFSGLLSGINVPATELAERLAGLVPGSFEKKVWFGLSGSDASEAAQRLVLRATGRPRVISFIGSWHGTTDATMALSAHPSLSGVAGGAHVTKIPYPSPYRNPFGDDDPGNLTDRCLGYLENYLFKTICPPGEVAAIFVESVQSDGGDVVPPPDFLPKLRALCDRYGILLVLDEIKVGMGRTGQWFGFQHSNIEPDLVLLGKALGGGLPLSAIVGRRDILDIDTGIALFTTAGNATSCAAGLAVVEEIERLGLVRQAAERGAELHERLAQALGAFEVVGDIRGVGMIQGIDLVTDRRSKEPNQPFAAKVVYRAWQLGLIVYYAGNWGNVLEITPPLILSQAQLDEGVSILAQAFDDVLAGKVTDEDVAKYAGW